MLSKDSITLGLSSASTAATENRLSLSSSSSSRLLSLIIPWAAVSFALVVSGGGLNGMAVTGVVSAADICGGRPGPSGPISDGGRALGCGGALVASGAVVARDE